MTNLDVYQQVAEDASIVVLEKQFGSTTVEDISDALEEYGRLFQAGIASDAEVLTLSRAYPDNKIYKEYAGRVEAEPIVVGGPASVEVIDREGHLITTDALTKAFDKYMSNFRTRNTMVLHSDVQVGWALPAYISKSGQVFKSGVDDKGLYFVTEIRNDTNIANRVLDQIKDGQLKSYSIAGSATKVENLMKGNMPYMEVQELDLAEVTVCEKGVNQGAHFEVLKADGMTTSQTCQDGSCLNTSAKVEQSEPEAPITKSSMRPFRPSRLFYKKNDSIDFIKSFQYWIDTRS